MRDDPWLEWKDDENAVSPVIAVILMVAITVVLAAVVYTWASGLAETGGGGGTPGSCSQGSGNFISIGEVPRTVDRGDADYTMLAKDTGDVYEGAEWDGNQPDNTEFHYNWSGTSSSSIQSGDSFQLTHKDDNGRGDQPGGAGGTEWADKDRFTFRIEDSEGTLLSCPFRWEE